MRVNLSWILWWAFVGLLLWLSGLGIIWLLVRSYLLNAS